jgi:hypothetical protein
MIRTIALALCLAAPLSTSAQTLDEIVAKHLEARGGLDRLQAIRTVRIIGREQGETAGVTTVDSNLGMSVIVEEKRPNLKRTTKLSEGESAADYLEAVRNLKGNSSPLAADEAPGNSALVRSRYRVAELPVATRVSAFDGTSNWEWSYSSPAVRTAPGNDAHDFGIESPLVDYSGKGSRVELAGTARTEGHTCYRLRVTSRQGFVRDVLIDAKTYLEVAVEFTPRGALPGWRKLYDTWKIVDGVMVPYTITTVVNKVKYQFRTDKVEFNVPIDDQRFAMPTGAR